jgi:hypothetical protein|nr:MAG TPA_asm: ribosome, girodazole, girolline, antibiotic complex, 50S [Caudoviricetes sp.]
MNRQFLADLDQYFQAKAELTKQEKELMVALEREKPHFCIVYIDRISIKCSNFRDDILSDNDMDQIANIVARLYCNSGRFCDLDKACEEFGLKKNPSCPICGNTSIYDSRKKTYQCESCNQKWSDTYTLVENPEETDRLPDDLGYPSGEARNSNARYIPEYEYIRIFKKAPEANSYFEPVCWPESQKFIPDEDSNDSILALNELINDEKGLEDFGANAVWVPTLQPEIAFKISFLLPI